MTPVQQIVLTLGLVLVAMSVWEAWKPDVKAVL